MTHIALDNSSIVLPTYISVSCGGDHKWTYRAPAAAAAVTGAGGCCRSGIGLKDETKMLQASIDSFSTSALDHYLPQLDSEDVETTIVRIRTNASAYVPNLH